MSPDLTRVPPPGRLGLLRGLERSSSSPNRPGRISNPVHRASEQSHARVEGSGILRLNRGCSLRQLFVQAPNQVDAPVHGREAPPAAGARWEAHYEVVRSGGMAGGPRGQLHSLSFSPSSYPSLPILFANHHPHAGITSGALGVWAAPETWAVGSRDPGVRL